jgi:pseudouridine synthase
MTAFTDREGRPTLADFIDVPEVYAAGRLDRDSEGLLLLARGKRLRTDLMAPDIGHPRTYLVQVEGIPDADSLRRLETGLDLKDGRTRPATVELLDNAPDLPERAVPIRVRKSIPDRWLRLTLTEGRNRQVRRMTAAVGHPTLRLVREQIGPVRLDGLAPGEWEIVAESNRAALVAELRERRNSRPVKKSAESSRPAPGRRPRGPRSRG